jgi:acetyltransferase
MREFFYPSSLAVFGVGPEPRNLAKNIISNCQKMGFKGDIHAVGKSPGTAFGREIITDPETLPQGIDLAVVLVPAKAVADVLDICGGKGIQGAIISTGGYSEYNDDNNLAERELLAAAKRNGIRFIGPNCIGVICTESGLCTPFNPMRPKHFKKGPISIIAQSGGVTTQSSTYFCDEHVGFSKIISVGNKLDLNEISFIQYLLEDDDTEQIHLYLESIDEGRDFIKLARESEKPIVIFKSNVTRTASSIAKSHTAALSNNGRIVDGALKQAGIVRVNNIHDMTVCAKALRLPPLKGNRVVAISLSGGFSVILGDAVETYGFVCPELPRDLIEKIESFRRGGVIRMSNPMDFGDVHDVSGLVFTLESCLALDDIDGLILSFMFTPEMFRMFGSGVGNYVQILRFIEGMCVKFNKPIGLSFFAEREHIEEFKKVNTYPVFNDAVESVRAMSMLRYYWQGKGMG